MSAPLTAPTGAVGWSPRDGWLYREQEIAAAVDEGSDLVLVVSADGKVRGVRPTDSAPLTAVLRVDGDIAEIVGRLEDLGDAIAGQDVGEATDVNELHSRLTALVHRVSRLEQRQGGDG